MRLPRGYRMRAATPADAAIIAAQRGQMFVDMGNLTPLAAEAQQAQWTGWLQGALISGNYLGFLIEREGEVVGGVGLMFFPKIPTLKDPATRQAHVLNMSVGPDHRRRGLAEALMHAALAEVRAQGLRSVTLNAAPLGRRLYERLGFREAANPELRLTLAEAPVEAP